MRIKSKIRSMIKKDTEALLIGFTTVASEDAAQQLARALVESQLAVCVQIDSGVQSVYRWEGKLCADPEWRLVVKFLESDSEGLAAFIDAKHPYDTPEWLVVRPEQVAPKYLAWAQAL